MDANHFENTTLESFKLRRLLGKGAFGKVFEVDKLHGEDIGETYAMKVVKKSELLCRYETDEGKRKIIEKAISERDILRSVEHPFIIKLHYSFQTETKLYLILEYASRCDLDQLLARVLFLSDSHAAFYINQVVLAVEYLHSRGIMHRDIKPANILLDSKGYIKLSDFGLSKNNFMTGRTYSYCGSFQFMAPEMFRTAGYTKEVDWWSVGALLCRMLTGLLPQFEKNENAGQAKFYGHIKPPARKLLLMLLRENVQNRLGTRGANEIKQHLYFKNTNWEKVLNRSEKAPFVPESKDKYAICRIFKNLFSKRIIDSTARSIDKTYNEQFKGFTFIGDIENAK